MIAALAPIAIALAQSVVATIGQTQGKRLPKGVPEGLMSAALIAQQLLNELERGGAGRQDLYDVRKQLAAITQVMERDQAALEQAGADLLHRIRSKP